MIDFSKLTENQWQDAESVFTDREASRHLVSESSITAGDESGLSVKKLCEAAASGQSPAALFVGSGKPVPLEAMRLYRAFLERSCLGASQQARAASTDEISARDAGPYRLEITIEQDAAFLVIDIGAERPPETLTLLNDEGHHEQIQLPEPIEGVVQMGISLNDERWDRLVELLRNPETSIYLH